MSGTLTETLTEAQVAQVDKYIEDIMSGRVFALHAASARSIYGYQPPINHRDYGYAIQVLASYAGTSDRAAKLVSVIIPKMNLYGTDGQVLAAMYDAAGAELRKGYLDVIGLAGPEPGRRSDRQSEYSLHTRVELLKTLEQAGRPFRKSVPGIGWCLAAVCERLGMAPQAADYPTAIRR